MNKFSNLSLEFLAICKLSNKVDDNPLTEIHSLQRSAMNPINFNKLILNY